MDCFLYARNIRHERVKSFQNNFSFQYNLEMFLGVKKGKVDLK